jgi:tetratricopeptide (TPR) repeat protein
MTEQFTHGYALLVGINENAVAQWALPDVTKDIAALAQVLTHPERCAYPEANVKVIRGKEATRRGILDGLDWLQARIRADQSKDATAVVYYRGHGWCDQAAGAGDFFLIPYDMKETRIKSYALPATAFAEAIGDLKPERLLVVLDCCHAAGMGVKDVSAPPAVPAGYAGAALGPGALMGGAKAIGGPSAKGLEELTAGHGRAVLSSSTGDQKSYIRRDGKMSIFTYHLIEALTGHAQPQEGATEVLVSDVMSHVYRCVPKSVKADWGAGAAQEPDYQVSGNFPVALLLGGQGLSKGLPAPDPLKSIESTKEAKVDTGGGDFVGRDKIGTLILNIQQNIVNGTYMERPEITPIFVGAPGAQEAVVKWLAGQQGVDKHLLENLGVRTAPEHVSRQIEEVQAAQKEAAARGVQIGPQAAYQLGMLAAYRRDYEAALDYFQQATQADPEYTAAFEAIAWLQQSRAMDDISRRDYDAAIDKLGTARWAAKETNPLDARAMAQRGFIAKTLAQVCEARGDRAGRQQYYAEAAPLFEQAAKLNPEDPSAHNGLGNVQYALGNWDAAIQAYSRTVELAPTYTAAYHDLTLAYEAKMKADPAHAAQWCRKALAAWQKAYHLAPQDPTFSADYLLKMGQHLHWLEEQCG